MRSPLHAFRGLSQAQPPWPIAAAGAGPFSPSQLTNLALWLRADLGVVGGATPTAWNDQSGKGNNLTTAAGFLSWSATGGPNSQAAITFGAATSSLSGTGQPATGSAYTLWLVVKSGNPVTVQNFAVLGSATKVALGANPSANRLMTIGANTQNDAPSTMTAGVWEAWMWIADAGGTQSFAVNGSAHSLSGNIAAATPDAGILLSNNDGLTPSIAIAEFIVQNGAASAGDQSSMNTYLTTRYGL